MVTNEAGLCLGLPGWLRACRKGYLAIWKPSLVFLRSLKPGLRVDVVSQNARANPTIRTCGTIKDMVVFTAPVVAARAWDFVEESTRCLAGFYLWHDAACLGIVRLCIQHCISRLNGRSSVVGT